MGAPGYTVFCGTGHIVKDVAHHFVDDREITECPYCKSHEFYEHPEWQDDDYDQYVPSSPIGKRNGVIVFDISKLKELHDQGTSITTDEKPCPPA